MSRQVTPNIPPLFPGLALFGPMTNTGTGIPIPYSPTLLAPLMAVPVDITARNGSARYFPTLLTAGFNFGLPPGVVWPLPANQTIQGVFVLASTLACYGNTLSYADLFNGGQLPFTVGSRPFYPGNMNPLTVVPSDAPGGVSRLYTSVSFELSAAKPIFRSTEDAASLVWPAPSMSTSITYADPAISSGLPDLGTYPQCLANAPVFYFFVEPGLPASVYTSLQLTNFNIVLNGLFTLQTAAIQYSSAFPHLP